MQADSSDSLRKSSYSRLKKAFLHQEADRVPYLDWWYVTPLLFDHIVGKNNKSFGPNPNYRSYEGYNSVPEDHVRFASAIGMDAIVCDYVYRPNNVNACTDDGETHYVTGSVKGWADLAKLEPPAALSEMRQTAAAFLDATVGTELGVIHTVTGICDPTYLSMGLTDFMYTLMDAPKFIEHMFDYFAYHSRRVIEMVCQFPEIEIVLINDDVATGKGLMMGPPRMRELWMPRTKWIIEPALKAGKILAYHSDGNVSDLIPMLLEMGFSAIHPVEPYGNDIYALKSEYGKDMTLVGNIDITLLRFGTPKQIGEDVKHHCNLLKQGGGYVVSSSNSIILQIPPENFLAMTNAVAQFGVY